jgi:hypothetical protein
MFWYFSHRGMVWQGIGTGLGAGWAESHQTTSNMMYHCESTDWHSMYAGTRTGVDSRQVAMAQLVFNGTSIPATGLFPHCRVFLLDRLS